MINTKYLLLASVCVLLNGNAQASEVKNLTFDYSDSPLVNTHTYTTHTPMELKPISSLDNAVKLAAVCAITGGCNGMDFDKSDNKIDFDNAYLCREDGYTLSSCPENYIKGAACPLDASLVKECISPETWCQNNGYNIKECLLPDYPDTACPHSPEYYKTCKTDNVRACKEEGYSLVCDTGKVRDGNQVCSYDDSFAKCVCDPCIGFDYTIAQASEQGYEPGEVCNSCGTIKYKRVENACEGYKTCDCGGEVGADVCYSGTTQKFDTCKECCDASVYKYDASNCSGDKEPAGNSCGGKFDTCKTICVSGYKYGTFDKDTSKCQIAINTLKETGLLDLQEDLYCGPGQNFYMTMCHTTPQKYKIRGNGHTITFDKDQYSTDIGWLLCGGTGYEPDKSDYLFEIENLKIIHDTFAWNHCYDYAGAVIKASNSKITNVDITSYIPALGVTNQTLELYGNNHIKMLDDGSEYAKESHVGADFTLYGNLDLVLPYSKDDNRVKYYGQMVVKPGAVLNVKGGGGHLRVFKGGKVNACLYSQTARLSLMWNSDNNKEDVKMTTYFFDYEQNDSVTIVPDLCSSDIFSGDFWK